MLEFTLPVEHFGRKFDRGMILCEFDALREPERTRFPQIGQCLRAKGIAFNEIPTPQMLWKGRLWPDLYIANQFAAVPPHIQPPDPWEIFEPAHPRNKHNWLDTTNLQVVSYSNHGGYFHDAFIEPMCRKITGRPAAEIAAKYHRAAWLPLFWPETLRARQSIPTPFYYPVGGYAGVVAERTQPDTELPVPQMARTGSDVADIGLGFLIARPREFFSVCFVVDDSPIYRVTNMDACAGTTEHLANHRLVVEFRGECNVVQEMERLGLAYHARQLAYGATRLGLPTLANVAAGWKPRPHMNDQLWSLMQ